MGLLLILFYYFRPKPSPPESDYKPLPISTKNPISTRKIASDDIIVNSKGEICQNIWTFYIAGVTHAQANNDYPQFLIPKLKSKEIVYLIPDPTNEHDPHAIKIVNYNNRQLGWYPAKGLHHNDLFSRLLSGEEVTAYVYNTWQSKDDYSWRCELKIYIYENDNYRKKKEKEQQKEEAMEQARKAALIIAIEKNLTDFQQELIEIVRAIYKNAGLSVNDIIADMSDEYFLIKKSGITVFRCRKNIKKPYWLIHMQYDAFKETYGNTLLKYSPSLKMDLYYPNSTRIFINTPQDLYLLQDLIIPKKEI